MGELEELKQKLSTPKPVAIITHRNPDGDAIGSSLALKLFLEKSGHSVKVVLPSDYPVIFEYMPRIVEAIIYDHDKQKAINALAEAEVLFCLDFNGLDRVDTLGPYVQDAKAYKALIDHHIDPEPIADYFLSDTSASSTCELIYQFIGDLGQIDKMDLDIATCLFTGLITDTGSFTYATNPNVFRVAADLKEIGVDDFQLNDYIFNSWTERQLQILGHSLRNRMKIYPELKAGVIHLTKQDYKKYQIARGDTEGVVNYIFKIKGMQVAAFIREMPTGDIRLSLRSKGDISVQELASEHFNGGGHKNASGGSSKESLEATVDKFVSVLPYYLK